MMMSVRSVAMGQQGRDIMALRRDPLGDDERGLDLQEDHRHVVVLVGAADERLDLAEDPLAQLARLEMAVLLDDPAQARLAEQIAFARSSPR